MGKLQSIVGLRDWWEFLFLPKTIDCSLHSPSNLLATRVVQGDWKSLSSSIYEQLIHKCMQFIKGAIQQEDFY